MDPNPDLQPEEVWSYQAGLETSIADAVWIKTTLFRHVMDRELVIEPYGGGPPAYNDIWVNRGQVTREGVELEFETAPFHHFSLNGGLAYVTIDPPSSVGAAETTTYNIGLVFDHPDFFRAELSGYFLDPNLDEYFAPRYDDFIWDLNLRRTVYRQQGISADLFFSAHNLFNGSQYHLDDVNPDAWMEVGLRLQF